MYYETVVEFETELGNDRVKKTREYFLVVADSVSYAEAQTVSLLEGLSDWTVISVRKSRIKAVKTDLLPETSQ